MIRSWEFSSIIFWRALNHNEECLSYCLINLTLGDWGDDVALVSPVMVAVVQWSSGQRRGWMPAMCISPRWYRWRLWRVPLFLSRLNVCYMPVCDLFRSICVSIISKDHPSSGVAKNRFDKVDCLGGISIYKQLCSISQLLRSFIE